MNQETIRNNLKTPLWFSMELSEVLGHLTASVQGLEKSQAEQRLQQSGLNTLETKKTTSKFKLLGRQVNNPLIYLLFAAAGVSLLTDHIVDAGVILGVITLNTLVGFVQEWRSEDALAALKKMISPHARVLRDTRVQIIDAAQVVPGDILQLETGDRVAADAYLVESDNLHANESALTGEAEPAAKRPGRVAQDTSLGDRHNMVWMSTSITGGRGRAVVTGTGMNTQMGSIAGQVSSVEDEQTPLQKRIHSLGIVLGILGVVLAAMVVVLGLLRGYETMEMLLFGVAVAVSAIPEGLPAVITVTLALGVRRMADRNALIRHLPTVETLGSTTVICTDKTGTITENQMTVRKVWAGGEIYNFTGEGYQAEGQIHTDSGQPVDDVPEALQRFLKIGTLANNAHLHKEKETWKLEGNPSEGAMLTAAIKAGLDPEHLRSASPRLAEIPFSSEQKYMAVLTNEENSHAPTVYIKGAPDRLLNFCSWAIINGRKTEMDESVKNTVHGIIENFGQSALRVIAGGFREFETDKAEIDANDVEQGITLAGLWGIIDPPRGESALAVKAAKDAGIKTVLITGDYAATALAIAQQVGIAGDGTVLGVKEIESMDDKELAQASLRSNVFARVSPGHKLKIMRALKKYGHVVAMTGDGVNDAPALKGADIGISMGQTGTEVAKEASDMILTDDNFATIVHAVEEGRVIFSNLRRVIFFLLATNLGEVMTLGGALILGLELPLTAAMILWINLVTDGACTVPLGVEPRHRDVLNKPPRDPREPIINRPMILRMVLLTPVMAIGTLLLFWYEINSGSLEHARTTAFTTMAVFQWFQCLNARSQYHSVFSIGLWSNRWLLVGLAAAICLQVGAIHTAAGQWLFGTVRQTWFDWLLIILVSSSIWVLDEVFKLLKVYGHPEQTPAKQDR